MAAEGRIILLPLLAISVALSVWLLLAPHPVLKGLTLLGWALVAFSLMFFRDPRREPPSDALAFLAPADGRVVEVKPIGRDDHIGGEALRISIFLSLFNVHVQRVPFDGEVTATDYRTGKFLPAFNQRAGAENEQAVTFFKANGGNFTVKQIAGLLARRVISYMQPGQQVRRGQRLGFIRFGSRVEIILPADFDVRVKVGDRVSGTTTIIGYFAT